MNTNPSLPLSVPHKKLLGLAIPLILTNISLPLVGLVDTAVLGHMGKVEYLAGASIGAFILTQIYWICGFLKMTTSGLSAQARGEKSPITGQRLLQQGLLISLVLGIFILMLSPFIFKLGLSLVEFNLAARTAIESYFTIRVWGAPAVLMSLTLMGWLVGQQLTRNVMYIQIGVNLLNLLLNLVLVFGLGMKVEGVALASICAEYLALAIALRVATRYSKTSIRELCRLHLSGIRKLLRLNHHILLRNLALQLCLAFVTFKGAQYGAQTAALNSILMQFFVLIALGLDGIANATEALVGEAKGAKHAKKLRMWVKIGLFWSALTAILYTLIFYLTTDFILSLLTNSQELILASAAYLTIILLLPLIAHWCFLFDAVFIGLTRAKAMQNSMAISAMLVFFPVWWIFSSLENKGLWIAMLAFLAARGATLGGYYWRLKKRQMLLI